MALGGATGERHAWMDGLRGWAIVAVVWFHAVDQVRSLGNELVWATALADAADPLRMPVLMGLSGAVLHQSLAKPLGTYLTGKLGSLAWPYALWSTALLVVAGAEFEDFLRIVYAPPTYLWYLAYLLAFHLACCRLRPRTRSALAPVALVVASATGAALPFLAAAFLIGDVAARHARTLVPLARRPWVIVTAWVATLVGAGASLAGVDLRYHPVSTICVAGAVVALGDLLHRLPSRGLLALAEAIGRQSIVYYASHYVVMTLIFVVLVDAGVTEPRVLLSAAVVTALAAGAVLARLRTLPLLDALWRFPPGLGASRGPVVVPESAT